MLTFTPESGFLGSDTVTLHMVSLGQRGDVGCHADVGHWGHAAPDVRDLPAGGGGEVHDVRVNRDRVLLDPRFSLMRREKP